MASGVRVAGRGGGVADTRRELRDVTWRERGKDPDYKKGNGKL